LNLHDGNDGDGCQRHAPQDEDGGGGVAGADGLIVPLAGVELDTVTNAVAAMSDKLVGGDKSAASALKTLGLNLDTLKQSKPDEAFLTIVGALGKMPDPMERAKVAFDVFGGKTKEVLRLTNDEFVRNAREGDGWSEDQIHALDDAGDAWQRLGDTAILWSGRIIASSSAWI
jgi:hypothetical protein